jgi:hypothetical protein
MKKPFLIAIPAALSLAMFSAAVFSGTIKDLENKVRKGRGGDSLEKRAAKGNCLIKVNKKTAAFQGVGSVKFYYVTYHSESAKPLTVKFTARGRNDDEFELPETGWGGSTTTGEQWEWEKNKGYLPKYFSKTKVGRRISKFEQNVPLIKKHGQIKAYKIDLLDGNTAVDAIKWNWDDTPYQRGLHPKNSGDEE